MTDEEKAEDYANSCCGLIKELHWQDVKWAVLYGLAEGRKEKWHDLRKNPDDLPKKKGEYRIYFYDSELKANRNVNWYYYGKSWACRIDVIAWCEIPQFEE